MRLSSGGTGWDIGHALLGIFLGVGLAAGPAFSQEPGPVPQTGTVPHFVQVAAGDEHTCALAADGAAYCWGANSYGQLGVTMTGTCKSGKENLPCSPQPVAVGGGQRFVSLTVGFMHTCGLTAAGIAYCWGDNTIGQLGVSAAPERCGGADGALPCSHLPVLVDSIRRFKVLTAARYHTCGLTTDGEVLCWGSNKFGQLGSAGPFDNCAELLSGQPTWACIRKPTPLAGNVRLSAIAAAPNHTCGLAADSTAYCWGEHYRTTPMQVSTKDHFALVAAGGGATCALTADGRPFCWGLLFLMGDKMIGVREPSIEGGAEKSGLRFTRLVVGQLHYCGLTVDGKLYCWGRGDEGQLGSKRGFAARLMKSRYVADAALVEDLPAVTAVAAGGAHTCVVTTAGTAYCWGINGMGQLGDGTTGNRQTPTAVAVPAQERPRA